MRPSANVGWRNNPVLLAKQFASVERIFGGPIDGGSWPGWVARELLRQPGTTDRQSRPLGRDAGDEFFHLARAATLTSADRLRDELQALRAAGTTDVILYPVGNSPQWKDSAPTTSNIGHARSRVL